VTGIAQAGQVANTGIAGGTPPGGLPAISAQDTSHYFGANPHIDIEKLTNGLDSDQPPGGEIFTGEPVIWTYLVTNTGNVTLTLVSVTDDHFGSIDCPQTLLTPHSGLECQASGIAVEGNYSNLGEAHGTYVVFDLLVSDVDRSYYLGVDPKRYYLPVIMR